MTARAHQPPHDRWRPTPIGDMPSAAPAKSKRAIRSERAEHHRVRTEKSAARRRHPRRPARSPIGTAEKESKQGSKRRTKRRTATVAAAFLLRKHEPEKPKNTQKLPWRLQNQTKSDQNGSNHKQRQHFRTKSPGRRRWTIANRDEPDLKEMNGKGSKISDLSETGKQTF